MRTVTAFILTFIAGVLLTPTRTASRYIESQRGDFGGSMGFNRGVALEAADYTQMVCYGCCTCDTKVGINVYNHLR